MHIEARLVTRDAGGNDGLVLGVRFKGAELLRPGRVYEIRNVMGELMIVDVGPSAVKPLMPDYDGLSYRLECCWGNSAGHLLECHSKQVFLTEEEAKR